MPSRHAQSHPIKDLDWGRGALGTVRIMDELHPLQGGRVSLKLPTTPEAAV
ncbi:MAG: hypothetical protein KGI91_15525 [Burkholderiales bacterium]|nr:hypothetical protein [Burkholderiales bacterium]MDE2078455.1 hypothetical protein [Burkholderiales bacterium]MDE2433450.1 hypothetical protein [Burkholderiales bacterium]